MAVEILSLAGRHIALERNETDVTMVKADLMSLVGVNPVEKDFTRLKVSLASDAVRSDIRSKQGVPIADKQYRLMLVDAVSRVLEAVEKEDRNKIPKAKWKVQEVLGMDYATPVFTFETPDGHLCVRGFIGEGVLMFSVDDVARISSLGKIRGEGSSAKEADYFMTAKGVVQFILERTGDETLSKAWRRVLSECGKAAGTKDQSSDGKTIVEMPSSLIEPVARAPLPAIRKEKESKSEIPVSGEGDVSVANELKRLREDLDELRRLVMSIPTYHFVDNDKKKDQIVFFVRQSVSDTVRMHGIGGADVMSSLFSSAWRRFYKVLEQHSHRRIDVDDCENSTSVLGRLETIPVDCKGGPTLLDAAFVLMNKMKDRTEKRQPLSLRKDVSLSVSNWFNTFLIEGGDRNTYLVEFCTAEANEPFSGLRRSSIMTEKQVLDLRDEVTNHVNARSKHPYGLKKIALVDETTQLAEIPLPEAETEMVQKDLEF